MQRKSSIHIDTGNLGYLFHNDRTKPTANSIFSQEKNEYFNNAITAIEIYRDELQKRTLAYTRRTGKKLHKNTITHLSAVVNLDERHNLQNVKKIAELLEQTLGTKVFQIAVHKDEGYVGEDGAAHINYHAHIEFLGLDEQGNSIRRKLTKSYLINLQSKVAEILQMQRGINYTAERKKRPKRLDTYEYKEHAKRLAQKMRNVDKKLQIIEKHGFNDDEYLDFALNEVNKLFNLFGQNDITNFNQVKETILTAKTLKKENTQLKAELAKVKDLKELNKQLREQLKAAGAKREQYAQLESYVKELKERVKAKELTIEQLKEQLQQMQEQLLSQLQGKDKEIENLKKQNKELLQRNIYLKKQLQNTPKPQQKVIEKEKIVYKEDTAKIRQLEKELEEQKRKNEELEQLLKQKDEEIEQLKEQLRELKNLRYIERKKHEDEIKELKERIKELEKDKAKIEQKSDKLDEIMAELERLQKEKNTILGDMERKREEDEDAWLLSDEDRFYDEYKQLKQLDEKIEQLKAKIKEQEKSQITKDLKEFLRKEEKKEQKKRRTRGYRL